MFGSWGVGESRCGGVAVWGSRGMGRLQRVGVAVYWDPSGYQTLDHRVLGVSLIFRVHRKKLII